MKFLAILMFTLSACSISVHGQAALNNLQPVTHFRRKPRSVQLARPNTAVKQMPAAASRDVIAATCPEDVAGAVCGYVKVPLDRAHPDQAKTQIYFELYPHSNPGPAQSAIMVNFGGPGGTTTGDRDFVQFLFAANLDVHDLLLIDDRGRGFSDAIDCEELQHGTTAFAPSEADCAAQLGNAASRYGTGDIAEDTEAVRAALGYNLVDYYGGSYGGVDVAAYATRFGKHLRSVVLDAPVGTPALDELVRLHFRTQSDPRMVRLDCRRSPTCSPDHPDPNSELSNLVRAIQSQTVKGDAFDASGNLVHVKIDEKALLNFVVTYPSGNFTSTGEILAAGIALKQGDPAPLLRLGAEGGFTLVGDSGDPTGYSAGAFFATACVDAIEAWDWSNPVSVRKLQYEKTVSNLPADYYAPFSRDAATGILFSNAGKQCLWWEVPTAPSPVALPHATYPRVPTLVLDGDLDNRVPLEETMQVAALFPRSKFVTIPEAGHETVFWTQCAENLVSEFIENLKADTGCANTPETIFPAVGRFPLLVKNARPASIDPDGNNQVGTSESKVVTVAVAAATDALQRSLIGSGDGVGLRGGTFHTDFGDTGWTTTLTGCEFAQDVAVSGTVFWGYDDSFVADLTVSGSGTAGGTLHVEGSWQNPGPVGQFKVSGTLGNKAVGLLVPEA